MWDYHAFGTYLASSPGDNRLVAGFEFAYPVHTPGFALHLAAQLPREQYDGQRYEPTTHRLSIAWFGLTADTLRAAVNAAMLAIVPGATWQFRAAESTLTVSTLVLDCSASEPYACVVDGRPATKVTFTIKTRAGWRAPAVTITPTGATTLPAVYSVPGVAGSMACPARITHTHDQATSKQALGMRHAPKATAGLIQDYQGTADTDALSNQAATATMDADGTPIGTPTTLDSDQYRGWYIAACRVEQPDATPGDTTYFATVTTTGSGVSESSTFVTEAAPATIANAYEVVYLGPLPIPAGPVPNVSTGAGYAAEAITASQTTHTAEYTITDEVRYGQTFPLTALQRLQGLYIRTGAAVPASGKLNVDVYLTAAGVPVGSKLYSCTLSGITTPNSELVLDLNFIAPAGGTYAAMISCGLGETCALRYNAAGGYASGTAVRGTAVRFHWTYTELATDLYFKLVTQAPLGFLSSVAISAANAGAGTAKLDTVALIPYDEWSVIAAMDCAATEGCMVDAEDGLEPLAYLYKADGSIGPVSQALVDWQGVPVIWPGDSAVVVAAQTPDDPPTGSDLIVTYWPTYQTPYGG